MTIWGAAIQVSCFFLFLSFPFFFFDYQESTSSSFLPTANGGCHPTTWSLMTA
jgi:hypothetical protein